MDFSRKRAAQLLRGAARRLDPATSTAAPPPQLSAPAELASRLAVPAEPGSRVISGFFDKYPRFYGTSRTANVPDRLNARYDAIFAENADLFDGATVLDVASHDGRWTLAALATGARYVTGIEGRPDLVENAERTLLEYGFGSDRVTFHSGDLFEVFARESFDVDVVLCLGFLYHTLRYHELWEAMVDARPEHILLDTESPRVMLGGPPSVFVQQEASDSQMNAIADAHARGAKVLTGRPNLPAIRVMAAFYGYEVERLSNWPAIIRDNPGLRGIGNYANYTRVTVRLKRK